jgi:hypothetical protein
MLSHTQNDLCLLACTPILKVEDAFLVAKINLRCHP